MRLEAVRDYHLKYDGFSMFYIKYQYVLFVFIDIVSICYYKSLIPQHYSLTLFISA